MSLKNQSHFSNSLRLAMLVLAIVLLQLNVPVYTAFNNSWSADFCYKKPSEPTANTWQSFKFLACLAKSHIESGLGKTMYLGGKFADFAKKHEFKSYRIIKVTSKKTFESKLLWPLKGRISSGFGMRRHPVTSRRSFHNGIDIKAKRGTKIVSPADGVVVSAGRAGLLGRMVKIQTAGGLTLYFGHMQKICCKKGQRISRGQIIGTVGSSGRATGPHLHFSVKANGSYANPLDYLTRR
ncbi:MAG: hypothetical protein Kow0029_17740 [Candidatus Rifleibacteriota bacterium]